MQRLVRFVHKGGFGVRFTATWNENKKDKAVEGDIVIKAYNSGVVEGVFEHIVVSDNYNDGLEINVEVLDMQYFGASKSILRLDNMDISPVKTITTMGSILNPIALIEPRIDGKRGMGWMDYGINIP